MGIIRGSDCTVQFADQAGDDFSVSWSIIVITEIQIFCLRNAMCLYKVVCDQIPYMTFYLEQIFQKQLPEFGIKLIKEDNLIKRSSWLIFFEKGIRNNSLYPPISAK